MNERKIVAPNRSIASIFNSESIARRELFWITNELKRRSLYNCNFERVMSPGAEGLDAADSRTFNLRFQTIFGDHRAANKNCETRAQWRHEKATQTTGICLKSTQHQQKRAANGRVNRVLNTRKHKKTAESASVVKRFYVKLHMLRFQIYKTSTAKHFLSHFTLGYQIKRTCFLRGDAQKLNGKKSHKSHKQLEVRKQTNRDRKKKKIFECK